MKRTRFIFLCAFITGFMFSCNPVRKMGDNAILLNRNIIKSDKAGLKEGIIPIIKQKPNRKILGIFRFHLGMYNLANSGDSSKFKEWVKRTIGEEPVLLDTALTNRSVHQVRQYMQNIGYFNAEVRDTTVRPTKHKANVIYYITTNQPYLIQNSAYSVKDSVIDSLIKSEAKNTLIHPGENYNAGILQKERERITSLLKNNGYYFFNQQYIFFKVDSSLKSNRVNIFMSISNPFEKMTDTTITARNKNHTLYTLNKIYIRTDYDPLNTFETTATDTILFHDYIFISGTKYFAYRPSAIADHIFFKSGEVYRLSDHENTYSALGDLGNFRFININFQTDSTALLNGENKLNCFIYLTPLLKQSYKIELEGTHNGGNLGAASNFIYSNRNTFRGAENLDLKLKTAVENLRNAPIAESQNFLVFNTYEIGPEARLNIPRVVSIFKRKRKSIITSTELNMSYNLQQRPEFFRRIADFSGGVIYKYSNYFRLQWYPAEINFVSVKPDPAFLKILQDIGDPALTASYEDHLITSQRASLIYTTQELNRIRNFIFFRANFETAGNLLRAVINFKNFLKNNSYTFLKNYYAQYLKPDIDFRYYFVPDPNNTVVFRMAGGIGLPYLNSKSLTFEKSFYAGGSNDLRAFNARAVGPGSYTQSELIQQTGEIKINGNLEYRFDIFRILQGAFFVDAGNVWLTHDDINRPGGKFDANLFYKEIAMGGGYGFRFNFTFFIFRVDLGYKFRDPSFPENERWRFNDLKMFDFIGNFGIGYPF